MNGHFCPRVKKIDQDLKEKRQTPWVSQPPPTPPGETIDRCITGVYVAEREARDTREEREARGRGK